VAICSRLGVAGRTLTKRTAFIIAHRLRCVLSEQTAPLNLSTFSTAVTRKLPLASRGVKEAPMVMILNNVVGALAEAGSSQRFQPISLGSGVA
jgi:hypothetical protein